MLRISGGTRTVTWNEFTRYFAHTSTSLIPCSYSRAWKRLSCEECGDQSIVYLLESQIGRFALAGHDVSQCGWYAGQESTNMIDVTCSCKTRNSCLMVNPPPGPGRMSPIEVVEVNQLARGTGGCGKVRRLLTYWVRILGFGSYLDRGGCSPAPCPEAPDADRPCQPRPSGGPPFSRPLREALTSALPIRIR